jgi:hypothetical protein
MQRACNLAADSAGRSGHQRGLARQIEHHGSPNSSRMILSENRSPDFGIMRVPP